MERAGFGTGKSLAESQGTSSTHYNSSTQLDWNFLGEVYVLIALQTVSRVKRQFTINPQYLYCAIDRVDVQQSHCPWR